MIMAKRGEIAVSSLMIDSTKIWRIKKIEDNSGKTIASEGVKKLF